MRIIIYIGIIALSQSCVPRTIYNSMGKPRPANAKWRISVENFTNVPSSIVDTTYWYVGYPQEMMIGREGTLKTICYAWGFSSQGEVFINSVECNNLSSSNELFSSNPSESANLIGRYHYLDSTSIAMEIFIPGGGYEMIDLISLHGDTLRIYDENNLGQKIEYQLFKTDVAIMCPATISPQTIEKQD